MSWRLHARSSGQANNPVGADGTEVFGRMQLLSDTAQQVSHYTALYLGGDGITGLLGEYLSK